MKSNWLKVSDHDRQQSRVMDELEFGVNGTSKRTIKANHAQKLHSERLHREANRAKDEDINEFESFLFGSEDLPSARNTQYLEGTNQDQGSPFGTGGQESNKQGNHSDENEQGNKFSSKANGATLSSISAVMSSSVPSASSEDGKTITFEISSKELGRLTLNATNAAGAWSVHVSADSIKKNQWLESNKKMIERGLARELGVELTLTVE
jgi:hypothetical protein